MFHSDCSQAVFYFDPFSLTQNTQTIRTPHEQKLPLVSRIQKLPVNGQSVTQEDVVSINPKQSLSLLLFLL